MHHGITTARKIKKFLEIGYSGLMDTSIQNLPDWLVSDQAETRSTESHDRRRLTTTQRELENITFENMFEWVITRIADGVPLKEILRSDFRQPEYESFLRWIHKDETRKSRYYEAQEIGAEIIASEILEIADADDTLEDVARSTLRINSRKWLLGVWNRKRFGDVKQIEQNVTIDIGAAMAAADERVQNRVIDITPKRLINE
jgi:uncharacterized membrane protein YkoI